MTLVEPSTVVRSPVRGEQSAPTPASSSRTGVSVRSPDERSGDGPHPRELHSAEQPRTSAVLSHPPGAFVCASGRCSSGKDQPAILRGSRRLTRAMWRAYPVKALSTDHRRAARTKVWNRWDRIGTAGTVLAPLGPLGPYWNCWGRWNRIGSWDRLRTRTAAIGRGRRPRTAGYPRNRVGVRYRRVESTQGRTVGRPAQRIAYRNRLWSAGPKPAVAAIPRTILRCLASVMAWLKT